MVCKTLALHVSLFANLTEKLLLFDGRLLTAWVRLIVVRVEVVDGRKLRVADLTQDVTRKKLQHKQIASQIQPDIYKVLQYSSHNTRANIYR